MRIKIRHILAMGLAGLHIAVPALVYAQAPSTTMAKPPPDSSCAPVVRPRVNATATDDVYQKKVEAKDRALAALPREQRVLRPKEIECDGRRYFDFDMYGTILRVPQDYISQLPPHGQFFDGHFRWPEKWAIGDDRSKQLDHRERVESKQSGPEDRDRPFWLNSKYVKFWVAADYGGRGRLVGKQLDQFRKGLGFPKSDSSKSEPKVVKLLGNGTIEYQTESGYPTVFFARKQKDIVSPDGDELVLGLRSEAPKSRDLDMFRVTFPYKGIEVSYFLAKLHARDWHLIHAEVIKLLGQWTKEN